MKYVILWKMKGVDRYFSAVPRPEHGYAELRDEKGRVIYTFHHGGADMTKALQQIARLAEEGNPEEVYSSVRENAHGFDLELAENQVNELERKYENRIKLVKPLPPAENNLAKHRAEQGAQTEKYEEL